jgi:hypothetical protein
VECQCLVGGQLVPYGRVGERRKARQDGTDERSIDTMGLVAVPVPLEQRHRTRVLTEAGFGHSDLSTEARVVADLILYNVRESGPSTRRSLSGFDSTSFSRDGRVQLVKHGMHARVYVF